MVRIPEETPSRGAAEDEAELGADADLLGPEMTARLSRLSLLARRLPTSRRRGRRRTRRLGAGTDAIDKRAYVAGDDVRRIDWSAFARFERLLVRIVADDAPLRLGLLIDTSGSMAFGSPSKLRQAARVAAGLAAVAVGAEDTVALASLSAGGLRVGAGSRGLRRVLGTLSQLRATGGTDLAKAARSMRSVIGGRGLCVVLSDLWDPAGPLEAARTLRLAGHDVVLARVLCPFERHPAGLDGFTLEDHETGGLLDLPPQGVLEAYAAAFSEYEAALVEGARELGVTWLPIGTEEAFDTVILRALTSGVLSARSVA